MTQENEMPGEIWAFNNCFPDDPGTYALNPHHGGQSYIRRDVTKEEAAMVAEYAKAQDKYIRPGSKLLDNEHRMKCWNIIERMAEAHK